MATTGSVLYVHEQEAPPQSAFSMTTASVYSEKTVVADKSFLKRLFRRKRSPSTPITHTSGSIRSNSTRRRSRIVVVEEKKKIDASVFVMMPSPHTHPLLSKPSARDELSPRPPTFTFSSHTGAISPSMEGFANARKMAAIGAERKSSLAGIDTPLGSPCLVPPDVYTKERREEERATRGASSTGAAALGGRYVLEWSFFIKCYAEGRFNVSTPPDPPPKRPSFESLSAPPPPNEKQRLKAVKQCSISLNTVVSEKCQRLAQLAKMVFQTRMASVSLVHDQTEIFKAGYTFANGVVDRTNSMGAHVVLSDEPMVVLDTAQDWRFQRHPLVTGNPHMRFYAGAPIVNNEGHTIGVFAVFDTQPRVDFPTASRRKLMDFARLVMTEMEIVMEEQDMLRSSKYMPTRVIGQKKVEHPDGNSVIARRGKLEARLLKGIQDDVNKAAGKTIPAGEITLARSISPTVTVNMWPDDVPGLLEPPPIPRAVPAPINLSLPPKTRKNLSKRDPFLFDDLLVPASPTTLAAQNNKKCVISSKPSTTVSVSPPFPTPPQTPSRPFSLTLATAEAAAEAEAEAAAAAAAAPSEKSPTQVSATPRNSLTSSSASGSTTVSPTSSPRKVRRRPRPTPLLPLPHTITSTAEANFATSLIARSLNYDLVYLLRVTVTPTPPSPLLPNNPYAPRNTVTTRILVAHGLPNPAPVFDANLHLRALRSVGGLIYQNPARSGELSDDVGYQVGILLPLVKDSDSDHKSIDERGLERGNAKAGNGGGIVLAAFARKQEDQEGKDAAEPSTAFTADEVRFLQEFGEAMKDILVKADT